VINYKYKGINQEGKTVAGVVEAETEKEAARVQKYFRGPSITIDSERIRQKPDISNYVVRAIMAGKKAKQQPHISEVREDLIPRINFDKNALKPDDPMLMLYNSFKKLYNIDISFVTNNCITFFYCLFSTKSHMIMVSWTNTNNVQFSTQH